MSDRMTMADLKTGRVRQAFLLDTSGTMSRKLPGKKMTRYNSMWENVEGIANATEEFLPDGEGFIICRFASQVGDIKENVKTDEFEDVKNESWAVGNTCTDLAIAKLRDRLFAIRAAKGDKIPLMVWLFTDGKPDDPKATARVIVETTKMIKDRKEFGIHIIQVGDDQDATDYLQVLNDDLPKAGAEHDIVAVSTMDKLEKISPPELLLATFTL
jgi:uncharacterized protein YegL